MSPSLVLLRAELMVPVPGWIMKVVLHWQPCWKLSSRGEICNDGKFEWIPKEALADTTGISKTVIAKRNMRHISGFLFIDNTSDERQFAIRSLEQKGCININNLCVLLIGLFVPLQWYYTIMEYKWRGGLIPRTQTSLAVDFWSRFLLVTSPSQRKVWKR